MRRCTVIESNPNDFHAAGLPCREFHMDHVYSYAMSAGQSAMRCRDMCVDSNGNVGWPSNWETFGVSPVFASVDVYVHVFCPVSGRKVGTWVAGDMVAAVVREAQEKIIGRIPFTSMLY